MSEAVNAGIRGHGYSAGRSGRLRGNLGIPAIVLMVVAAAAPLSVIGGNLPIGMVLGDTSGIPVAFAVAGIMFLLFAVSFVAMSKFVSDAGAFYAYIQLGLGRAFGTGAAVLALPAYMATLLAVAAYDGVILADLVQRFAGATVPWWSMTALALAVVAWLGYRDIDLSAKVLGVFLASEIAMLVVLDLVIVIRGGEHGLTGDSFTPHNIAGGFGIALLYALWGFVGIEATAVFRDEARDPDRTVALATYWAVGIVGVFYAFSAWALIEGNGGSGAVAVAKADPDNFMVNTAQRYLGMLGRDLTTLLWFVSVFACTLAFHNISARYAYALAERGVIGERFGRAHPRHGSPANASLLITGASAVVMAALVGLQLDPVLQIFGPLGGVGMLGLAILWLLTTLSVVVFFTSRGGARRTVVLASLATLVLAAGLGSIVWNLTQVIGGSRSLAVMLGLAPVVIFAVGMVLSRRANADSLSAP